MAKNKTATVIFKGDDQISPAIKGATNSVAGLGDSFKKAETSIDQTTASVRGLKNAFNEIKTGISREIGAQIAQGLAQIPSAIASTTLQFEKLQTTLKSTLGSQSAADEAFTRIKDFAASTPFQVSEITDSFIKLQNRGIAPTTPLLRQLGDLASSQGKSLNQVTEAILDASTGEFERLKEFGIQASKSGDQVTIAFKGVEQTVSNTPQAINKAVASLGDLQGVSGGMEAQSKTLGGALSNLQDTADTLSVAFGEGLTPVLLEIVKGFSASAGESEGFARSLGENAGSAIKFLVDNGGALKTILELLVIQFGLVKVQALAAAIATATSGTAALTAAGGFTALGLAIGTATAAIAPLALAFATIKGIEFAKFANDLKAFNDEFEVTSAGTVAEGNAAFKLATQIQNLNNKRKAGLAITKEQQEGFIRLADQEIAVQKKRLDAINSFKPLDEAQRNTQNAARVGIESTIKALERERKALAENGIAGTKNAEVAKRSNKEREDAIKKRIDLEKRALEDSARLRGREFEAQAKGASTNFESKARTEKQAFETKLNADKKAFEDSQKSDKEQFEKSLQATQRSFNDSEKSKDRDFQKSKQDLERAFNQEQQKAKADFDKQQQESSRAFDARQNSEKTKAEGLFAQRRLEIERKLQLDAANTPEDRAKLEAEFKAADEKAALEKAAFAQLKADEEAFALKQQAEKVAFDDAQKLKDQEFQKAQQDQKITFDDAQKLKDLEFEKQKEATKLAFENTLKAKRDELEAAQTTTKLAFEEQIAIAKQEFEDAERTKKDAFETAQNLKKQQFEDSERIKKQTFEDNLKTLEAKFSAEERAKDIATAKQVAAIKNTSSATAKIGAALGVDISPRAKGGRFNAGQQLLVGEQGQEIVTFGNSGFVSTAADTKQILSSNTSAPSSVSTARMEALLTQLVGKLDRPNVSVTTSENPSDVYVKIQREAARSAAMQSGI
jgi:hypothetical protein